MGGDGAVKYKGPLDVVKKLYVEGGIRSLYRGTMATLLRGKFFKLINQRAME
jgi:solute carrier family 25 carnitine/acylcarnitine transporter 20/29